MISDGSIEPVNPPAQRMVSFMRHIKVRLKKEAFGVLNDSNGRLYDGPMDTKDAAIANEQPEAKDILG